MPPLPKDPEDRLRRNKTGENGIPDAIYETPGQVKPPSGVSFENREVQDLWGALQASVHLQIFEPSDWAYAVLALRLWDSALAKGSLPGAMLLSALDGMLGRIMVAEADRRKLRIFSRREREVTEPKVKAEDFYRDAFAQQQRARLHAVSAEDAG